MGVNGSVTPNIPDQTTKLHFRCCIYTEDLPIRLKTEDLPIRLKTEDLPIRLQNTLAVWCQDNNLSLNVSKTKELIVDYRKRCAELAPLTTTGL